MSGQNNISGSNSEIATIYLKMLNTFNLEKDTTFKNIYCTLACYFFLLFE